MQKKFQFTLIVLIALIFMASGCARQIVKNEINYCVEKPFVSLDPVLAVDESSMTVMNAFLEGLVRYKENKEFEGALAEDWTISDDGKIYRFKIRDNATWSNGEPVTANDFEFAWKRALNPQIDSAFAYQLYYIKNAIGYNKSLDENYTDKKNTADEVGIKALDEKTLEVELEKPTPQFLGLTAFPIYFPVQEKFVTQELKEWAENVEEIPFCGPFAISKYSPDEYIILEKNPNYWDQEEVKLEKIKISFIANEKEASKLFSRGKLDIVENPPLEEYDELLKKGQLKLNSLPAAYYITLNTTREPLEKTKVRQALALALDREKIVYEIVGGGMKAADAFVPNGFPDTAPGEDFREKGGELLSQASLGEVQVLLEDAGFPKGEGFPVISLLTINSEGHKRVAEAVQKLWQEELGIDVELQEVSREDYYSTLRSMNYDCAVDFWRADYLDAMTFLELFINPIFTGTNYTGWVNEAFNLEMDKARISNDKEIRMTAMHRAEEILLNEMPAIPLFFYNDAYLVKNNIQGYVKNGIGTLIDFKYASIKE